MSPTEHKEVIESLNTQLSRLRATRIVSLKRYRELKQRLARSKTDLLVANLRAELLECSREQYLLWGRELTRWIADLCRTYRVPRHRKPSWLARWVAQRPAFWRSSQKVRKCYAEFNDVPRVEVPEHVRAGRRICCHERLMGNQHLLDLPLDEHPDVVGEVLRLIATGAHRPSRTQRAGPRQDPPLPR